MEKFIINGGKKLKGEISVSGSKNVALKALVAACLTQDLVTIENIPLISDFMTMADIIKELGGEVKIKGHKASVQLNQIKNTKISLDSAASIRTSAMFLAPLLSRKGHAVIPNPGGCRIGARPIDRIIDGLSKMGIETFYNSKDGYFYLNIKGKIKGVSYRFSKNTHTGTETLILAAVLSEGQTILENAAAEPEVDDLISLLNSMGAKIKRVSPRTIVIDGVNKLHGTRFEVPPDRNEIITFAVACIATKGSLFIKNITRKGINEFLEMLEACGGGFEEKRNGIRFFYKKQLIATNIATSFYPGFMTDWQSPWAVLMSQAKGASVIHETVYENRFGYIEEIMKMGAKISLFNPKVENPQEFYNFNHEDNKPEYKHAVKIFGPIKLHNAVLNISDLRAGATLVLAALLASGQSTVFGIEHLDRGYEEFDRRLKKLGADITRTNEK
ncbi:UDP-N-acetylglucosamine 1-carboxyvinyltransferase [Patescibacteria group bacterium]|nr:UDP-N-acetylglucosamine 1-carboxyvinyltransferase [Patescibacteria group bacterium]